MLQGIPTRIACKNKWVEEASFAMKEVESKTDIVLMEYHNFFKLLSYYLPISTLNEN